MLRLLCITFSLFLLQACATNENNKSSIESSEKSVALTGFDSLLQGQQYYNPTLPITLTLPEKWLVQKLDKSTFAVAKDKPSVVIKPKLKKAVLLLNLRSPSEFANLSLLSSKINISENVAITLYSNVLKKKLKESGRFSFSRPQTQKVIAGKEYTILPVEPKSSDTVILQDYYTTAANNKLVVFILTYINQEQLTSMEKIISTASFEK